MRAISVKQPWAQLLAIGEKRFETRAWATTYRGPIVIHASRITQETIADCMDPRYGAILRQHGFQQIDDLPFGAVIATAELLAIHATDRINHRLTDHERELGNFADGRFAWELTNVRLLSAPVRHRGFPGVWEFDGALLTGAA